MKDTTEKKLENANAQCITQFSTLEALNKQISGHAVTIEMLRNAGGTALGVLPDYGGAFIMAYGNAVGIHRDGALRQLPAETAAAMAVVVDFRSALCLNVTALPDMSSFFTALEKRLNLDLPAVILFRGDFKTLKCCSTPFFGKSRSAESAGEVREFTNEVGLIAGFRFPDLLGGVNVPGWHLGFINSDFSAGGRVLEFALTCGTVEICECAGFRLEFPVNPENRGFASSSVAAYGELN